MGGAGTSQRMVIAKKFNKLVATVLAKDSHYYRVNIQIKHILYFKFEKHLYNFRLC